MQVTITRKEDNTYHVYMLCDSADGDYDVPTLREALDLAAELFRRN